MEIIVRKCFEKSVIAMIIFSDFSSSDASDEEKMFFDKSLSFLLFNVLLTRKYAGKV